MKNRKRFLTLVLLLGAWSEASTIQAAVAGGMGAWARNDPDSDGNATASVLSP